MTARFGVHFDAMLAVAGATPDLARTLGGGHFTSDINGTSGDDHLIGNDGTPPGADDTMNGLGGNDLLEGLGGNDVLYGGGGIDVLIGGNDHDTLYGGAGDDTLNGAGGDHTTFTKENRHDATPTEVLDGGAGNDTMIMHYANYILEGNPDRPLSIHVDITTGTGEAEVFFGNGPTASPGESFTSIEAIDFDGPNGNDQVTGGALSDTIAGNGGNDVLNGAGGDDAITDGDGFVTADGGSGTDSFGLVRDDRQSVVIDANAGTITVGGVSQGSFINFENLTALVGNTKNDTITGFAHGRNILGAGSGDDTLTGGNQTDQLYGGFGNDVLSGGGGDDKMDGGPGNDTVHGGGGNDTIGNVGSGGKDQIFGDGGDDTLVVDETLVANGSVYDGGAGTDTLLVNNFHSGTFDLSKVTITGFEKLDDGFGGTGPGYTIEFTAAQLMQFSTIRFLSDTIQLADRADVTLAGDLEIRNVKLSDAGQKLDATGLTGNIFNIFGGAGNDNISANGTVYGGDGNDTISGGAFNDFLTGGAGGDHLDGGAGADIFSFAAVADSTGVNFDTVSHFDANAQDKFDLPSGVSVTGIDATVAGGQLRTVHFDVDLGHAIGGAQLAIGHAVLFTPTSGDYTGDTFLVVDANATAGYQAGADIVVLLSHPAHLNALDAADFI